MTWMTGWNIVQGIVGVFGLLVGSAVGVFAVGAIGYVVCVKLWRWVEEQLGS